MNKDLLFKQVKERFEKEFKNSVPMPLNVMFGRTVDMIEDEFEANVLWREFGTGISLLDINKESFTKEDLKKLFENPDDFSHWTFEVEIENTIYEFSVNFTMKNKELFTSYAHDYIDSEHFTFKDSIDECCDIFDLLYDVCKVITYCKNSIAYHLIISNISIADTIY